MSGVSSGILAVVRLLVGAAIVLVLLGVVTIISLLFFSGPSAHPHSVLLRNGGLVGLTKTEVINRVGAPARSEHSVTYLLGGTGSAWAKLVIHYDLDTNVVRRVETRSLPSEIEHTPFDAKIWRDPPLRERWGMVRSLLARGLVGKGEVEINALLGPPDSRTRHIGYVDRSDDWVAPTLVVYLKLDENHVVVDSWPRDR